MAAGPSIRSGVTVTGARAIDLAPTLLHLSGVPIPPDMDGRVLDELVVGGAAPRGGMTALNEQTPHEGAAGLTAEEQAVVAAQLRGLGYLRCAAV